MAFLSPFEDAAAETRIWRPFETTTENCVEDNVITPNVIFLPVEAQNILNIHTYTIIDGKYQLKL